MASTASPTDAPADAFDAWMERVDEVDDEIKDIYKDLAGAVKQWKPSDKLALLDRNKMDADEWRPVYLHVKEEAAAEGAAPVRVWNLYTILNVPIDEPDDNCSIDGFTESSFLQDVDAGYYKTYSQVNPSAEDRVKMREKAGVPLVLGRARRANADDDDIDDARQGSNGGADMPKDLDLIG
jgi:hypothetical protein